MSDELVKSIRIAVRKSSKNDNDSLYNGKLSIYKTGFLNKNRTIKLESSFYSDEIKDLPKYFKMVDDSNFYMDKDTTEYILINTYLNTVVQNISKDGVDLSIFDNYKKYKVDLESYSPISKIDKELIGYGNNSWSNIFEIIEDEWSESFESKKVKFGYGYYILNNGTYVRIEWIDGNSIFSGGLRFSDNWGKEVSYHGYSLDVNEKKYNYDNVLSVGDLYSKVVSIGINNSKNDFKIDGGNTCYFVSDEKSNVVDYETIIFNKEYGKIFTNNFLNNNPNKKFRSSYISNYHFSDKDIIDNLIKKWGYKDGELKIVKWSEDPDYSDKYKTIKYIDPITKKEEGAKPEEPKNETDQNKSAEKATQDAQNNSNPPASNKLKLKLVGIEDGFTVKAKIDVNPFKFIIGDLPKEEDPSVPPTEIDEFNDVEGVDDEYFENPFEGPEEKDLEFSPIQETWDIEKDDSGSAKEKESGGGSGPSGSGGSGTQDIGPLPAGLPANEMQKEAIKKAMVASGCKSSGGGACARYSWNIAKNYHRYLKGMGGLSKQEAAGGNANQNSYHKRLGSELKYTQIENKSSVTKADLVKMIKNTKWGVGDVICYWSNDKNISNFKPGHRAYGHSQVYVGTGASKSGWACDRVDNYGASFVYNSANDNDWGVVVFRSPNTKPSA